MYQTPKPLRELTEAEFEAVCDGCAKCCSVGLIPQGEFACPGLDTTCNRCTVYEKRLTTHMCLKVTAENVQHLHAVGILPDSCAYVRHEQGLPPLKPAPRAQLQDFKQAPGWVKLSYQNANAIWHKREKPNGNDR